MHNELLKSLSKKLVANPTNYMESFRENLHMYVDEKAIKLKDIAEESDIPFETLKSFIYGDSKDCKLSTAVSLARALGVSVDELIGSGTLSPKMRESIAIIRNLPANYVYFVHWCINYHEMMLKEKKTSVKAIDIMYPEYVNDTLKLTNNFELLDISDLEDSLRQKIFMGIRITCDNYMPLYSPYDVILIANDRPPKSGEHVVITRKQTMWIVTTKKEGDKLHYYSIRDKKLRGTQENVDEVVGYVAAVHSLGGDFL